MHFFLNSANNSTNLLLLLFRVFSTTCEIKYFENLFLTMQRGDKSMRIETLRDRKFGTWQTYSDYSMFKPVTSLLYGHDIRVYSGMMSTINPVCDTFWFFRIFNFCMWKLYNMVSSKRYDYYTKIVVTFNFEILPSKNCL